MLSHTAPLRVPLLVLVAFNVGPGPGRLSAECHIHVSATVSTEGTGDAHASDSDMHWHIARAPCASGFHLSKFSRTVPPRGSVVQCMRAWSSALSIAITLRARWSVGRSVGRSAPGRRARGRRAFRDSRGDPPDSDGPTRSPHSEPTTRVRVAVFNLKVFRTPRPGLRFDGSRRNSARCPRTAPRPANSPRRRGACQWQCQWQWPSQWGSGFHAGYSVWQLRKSLTSISFI